MVLDAARDDRLRGGLQHAEILRVDPTRRVQDLFAQRRQTLGEGSVRVQICHLPSGLELRLHGRTRLV